MTKNAIGDMSAAITGGTVYISVKFWDKFWDVYCQRTILALTLMFLLYRVYRTFFAKNKK